MFREHMHREPSLDERAGFYLCQIAAKVHNAFAKETVEPTELDIWDDPWGEIADAIVEKDRAMVRGSLNNRSPE